MVVAIVAISWTAILQIVKMGIRYSENIERIRHGYPTLNGDTKIGVKIEAAETDFIDMTPADNSNGSRQ
jgi:hypothetical protein